MTEKGKRHTMAREDLMDRIIKMRVKLGKSRSDIFEWLTKDQGYAASTAYQYMREAKQESDERAMFNFGDDLREDIERHETDRSNALDRGDFKLATEILKDICKLKGHYIERTDVTSGGKEITEIKLIHIKGTIDSKPSDTDDEFFDSLD